LRALSAEYPIWLCDVWGVVHNGHHIFERACDCLTRHRENGGHVILLTNSPRSHVGVEAQLDEMGVPRAAWDGIVTSGDVTRDLMIHQSSSRLFHIGPDRDQSIFEGLAIERVPLDEASAIICTGLFDEFSESPGDYRALLQPAINRTVPFICANPDLVVRKGTTLIPCAGAIAQVYGEMGGTVLMAGKPYKPIYDLALERAAVAPDRSKALATHCLAIGDGIDTDIRGAANQGIAVVLISDGINAPGTDLKRVALEQVPHATIVADMPELAWD
jgi:HAD superfamily hydrolase (TIGR01459 family)